MWYVIANVQNEFVGWRCGKDNGQLKIENEDMLGQRVRG